MCFCSIVSCALFVLDCRGCDDGQGGEVEGRVLDDVIIRLKSVSSASSVRTLYIGVLLLQYSSLLHRLRNDSSLARSAAEHEPDHVDVNISGSMTTK